MIPVATAFAYALQLIDASRSVMTLVSDAQANNTTEISAEMFAKAQSRALLVISDLDALIKVRRAAEDQENAKAIAAFDPASKQV